MHYKQLELQDVGDGDLVRQANDRIARVARELIATHADNGSRDGKATVTIKLTIEAQPGTETIYQLRGAVTHTLPATQTAGFAQAGGDKLLCQPEGAGDEDPNQGQLFDKAGNEITPPDEPDVVDRIGGAAAGQ